MVSRIIRLLIFVLLLVVVLYVVLLNRDPVTVHLGEGASYTAMGGVVLISIFVLGILTASVVGLMFGIRSYLREQKLHARERQRRALNEGLMLARSYAANHEWNKARAEYDHLVKKHPRDVVSRVELSRVVEGQGDPREALRILDAARAEEPENVEVLLRAAELNVALRNKTAAIDNLALVLLHQPSRHAARLARDLSEDLECFDDALEYQERLDSLGYDADESAKFRARIRFRKLLKDNASSANLKDLVAAFVKKEPSPIAIEKLAELEGNAGSKEQAAQHLARLARESHSIAALRKAVNAWIEINQPQQALAAVRAVLKNADGIFAIQAEMELIRAFISLRMLDEAKSALVKLPSLISERGIHLTAELSRELLALQAYTFVKLGDTTKAGAALRALTDGTLAVDWDSLDRYNGAGIEAPAPRLSTP